MNKDHIKHLIDFLYKEVLSAGGDGDALWYSKYFTLEELMECFQEYDDDNAVGWRFEDVTDDTFNWGIDQEWITVTTSSKLFIEGPDWQQIKIQY